MGVFTVLVAFFFLASNFVSVPSREGIDQSLDLIMLESIAMPEAAEVVDEETEDPSIREYLPEASPEDFDGLLSVFTELVPSEPVSEESALPDRGQIESLALQSDVGLDFGAEEGLDLSGYSRSGDLNADLFPESGGATWTLRPNLISGAGPRSGARLSSGAAEAEVDLTIRPDRPERLVESLFGEQGDALLTPEEILRENAVVRWMQDRQNALDRPIRTHFEQQARDLTVNEPITVGAKTYHLQMMYSPVTRTLHIAWIDGNELFYFVDPSLQFQANYFEEGLVERALSMEVVLLETEELSAHSPQAIREYGTFLNWWRPQIEQN